MLKWRGETNYYASIMVCLRITSVSTLVPTSWYTGVWKFISEMGITIKGWKNNLQMSRVGDVEIMRSFALAGYTKDELRALNNCRISLQVITLADITTADGMRIATCYLNGKRDPFRKSKWKWPQRSTPSLPTWMRWKDALRNTFCKNHKSNSLRKALGPFIQQMDRTCFYSPSLDSLYKKDGSIYRNTQLW